MVRAYLTVKPLVGTIELKRETGDSRDAWREKPKNGPTVRKPRELGLPQKKNEAILL